MEASKIYIYVKQSPRGLLYLGKTTQDPYLYKGSGIRWKNHLKKYSIKKEDIKTWILHETYSEQEVKELGLIHSKLLDVVNSDMWANMKEESGDGGFGSGECHPWFGRKKTIEHKKKLAQKAVGNKSRLGKPHLEETKRKQSESQKGRKKKDAVCPHCGKKGNENVMYRWHFDKCPTYTGVKHSRPPHLVLKGENHPFFGKKRPKHSEFMRLNNPKFKK